MIGTSRHAALGATRRRPPASASLIGTRLWQPRFLSAEEHQALQDVIVSSRWIRAGTDLVRERERADNLLIVVEGWACRYTTTGDGARQLPALLVPGDVANLDSLLFERIDYGVRTLTDATIMVLPRDRALELCTEHAGIARMFTWLALVENAVLSKWAQSLGRRTARARLAHLLCELSVRLDAESDNESRFELPLTQEQLADALGLTSVHVNRMMQQLRSEKLVVVESRKAIVPDVARLRQAGGFDPAYLHLDPPTVARAA